MKVVAASLLCAVGALESAHVSDGEWALFKEKFGKQYTSEKDELDHFQIFQSNLEYIYRENSRNSTYRMGVNEFTDISLEEFSMTHFGLSKPTGRWGSLRKVGVHEHKEGDLLDSSVDWVSRGAVTAVKNQGQCGSCWSFSTTGSIEGAWEIATGNLVSISEQQFVDCSKQNSGCNGGLMDYALSWAEGQDLCTESSYPYTASDGTCSPSGCTVAVPKNGVTGYIDVAQSESSLMSAVNKGPVSIAIEADRSAFQSYKSGVLQSLCGTSLDHGVLAVGYGVENSVKYWKVKNSWGASWGESGYIRLLRGKSGKGECGILSSASYPTVNPSVPTPSPSPSPAPTPAPTCKDTSSFCIKFLCEFTASECQQTCGCCDSNPPSYCSDSALVVV